MPVESASFISELNPSYPTGAETKAEGDNHIRMFKAAVQGSFTSLGAAAVTKTAAELNSVTDRALRAGDTYTGTHAFTGATVTVPTVATADNSTNAASTAMVQAAIAGVNATSSLAYSTSAATSFAITAGEVIAATSSSAVAVTFPASPTTGTVCGVHFDNTRTDNTVDMGANAVLGWNGATVSGAITCDQKIPLIVRWGGDYWRAV